MTTHVRCATRISTLACVLLSTLALARPAHADPIAVTGGVLQGHITIREAFFTLTGQGFLLDGGLDEGFFSGFYDSCQLCQAGTTVDLSSRLDVGQGTARAIVDGVTYSRIWIDGSVGTFTTPSAQIEGSSSTALTLPFAFEGMVHGYASQDSRENGEAPLFTAMLLGSGLARGRLEYSTTEGGFFASPEIRYEFDAAQPVPEPATLLLCGFGVAAIGAARRRQRAARGG
jgi:hypothetical protein